MSKSKKIAAVAGVLGGVALIGAGAVQAVGVEGSGRCVKDGKGTIRCEQAREYRLPAGTQGKVRFANEQKQTCSGSGADISCVNGSVLGGRGA
ncbi:hypothetical protein [Streptomyces sp. NEAU-W12]|uniref:hypothetical protein n=1 Tax=Streptomyces sp. NEAU-W12 TaxID=2994668 RepID=UPI00224B5AFC|nr:hypothetical protein [Streptomyces sp. NEAU-W12]MCX2927604.1 hypothetical protein [Streptomyces sp. NEAU-W12]